MDDTSGFVLEILYPCGVFYFKLSRSILHTHTLNGSLDYELGRRLQFSRALSEGQLHTTKLYEVLSCGVTCCRVTLNKQTTSKEKTRFGLSMSGAGRRAQWQWI